MRLNFKELALNAAIVLGTILVFLLLLEFGLRVFSSNEIKHGSFFQYDELLGWRSAPGEQGLFTSPEYNVQVSINSKGFRDSEWSMQKPAGTMRVAVLGDSYVQASEVDKEQRFTELLQQKLNAGGAASAGARSSNVEVMNFGVGGFGIDQELLAYKYYARNYSPDLVILAVFMGNDFTDMPRYQVITGPYKPRFVLDEQGALVLKNVPVPYKAKSAIDSVRSFLIENSYAYNFISDKLRKVPFVQQTLVDAGVRQGDWDPDMGFFLSMFAQNQSADVKEVWLLSDALLADFKSSVEADGGKLIVLIIPQVNQVYGGLEVQDVSKPNAELHAILDRNGIAYVDLLELMQVQNATGGERLYYTQDPHLNPAGHEFVAGLLLPEVKAVEAQK